MVSSADKMEEIVKLIRDLDGLDVQAWEELTRGREGERAGELATASDEAMNEAHSMLAAILPLMKVIRLMIASESLTPLMRTMVVRSLIPKLLTLLNPLEVSGVLMSVMHDVFDKAKPTGAIPMMIVGVPNLQEREDESRMVA